MHSQPTYLRLQAQPCDEGVDDTLVINAVGEEESKEDSQQRGLVDTTDEQFHVSS